MSCACESRHSSHTPLPARAFGSRLCRVFGVPVAVILYGVAAYREPLFPLCGYEKAELLRSTPATSTFTARSNAGRFCFGLVFGCRAVCLGRGEQPFGCEVWCVSCACESRHSSHTPLPARAFGSRLCRVFGVPVAVILYGVAAYREPLFPLCGYEKAELLRSTPATSTFTARSNAGRFCFGLVFGCRCMFWQRRATFRLQGVLRVVCPRKQAFEGV